MNKTGAVPPRGRPTAAQADQVPERLLDAATWLFAHQGYSRTSMESIAKLAGASSKTVYSRYANKEAVLRAVVRRMFDRAVKTTLGEGTIASDEPLGLLRQLGHDLAQLSAAPTTAGVNRLIMAEAFQVPELADLFLELHNRATALVREPLQRWKEAGLLPRLADIDSSAKLFVEMVASMPRLHALLGRPLSPLEVNCLVDNAVHVFLVGCGFRFEDEP
ncbi:MAG: TetR/AcrR family transcriptional regulator [Fimbriimonadaceae bacterium]|nr:TetR/AcrR family transcriptional regulator [Fimbriimonadaceae bacterium]